jgi:demethylmenaquinone methyltransferase/2-methoxy-6-polyprenyl-1,4-benzoquinol methylase
MRGLLDGLREEFYATRRSPLPQSTMKEIADSGPRALSEPRQGSGEMFDAIAPRYDLLNRLLSFGVDQRWRRRLVAELQLRAGARVLDHATGTADLAIRIAESLAGVTVLGLDPSNEMLRIGREKIRARELEARVELRCGDAQDLSGLAESSFDAVSIAFGIRNVVDRGRALREFARVTRSGGRIAVLELSEPHGGWLGPLARWHVHRVVPWLGALLSGAQEYRYLQRSIAAFPPPEEFAALMAASGIRVDAVLPLTFGVCHLYVGTPAK